MHAEQTIKTIKQNTKNTSTEIHIHKQERGTVWLTEGMMNKIEKPLLQSWPSLEGCCTACPDLNSPS